MKEDAFERLGSCAYTCGAHEVRANNLLDDPAVKGIIVSSRDITDRVNAEAALHERERLYRTIVETADEGIWMIDADAITTFANTRMAEITAAIAAVSAHQCPDMRPAGAARRRQWLQLSKEQHDASLELIRALKEMKPAEVKNAASNLNKACVLCH